MQSQGSTVPSQTSTASAASDRPSDGEFIRRQLKLLAGNYANSALSAEDTTTAELYRDEIAAMVKENGQERVAAAIRQSMRVSRRFLAEVGVIWDLIPPAFERRTWDPDCQHCGGSGWRIVREGPGKPQKAARCNCLGMRRVS